MKLTDKMKGHKAFKRVVSLDKEFDIVLYKNGHNPDLPPLKGTTISRSGKLRHLHPEIKSGVVSDKPAGFEVQFTLNSGIVDHLFYKKE